MKLNYMKKILLLACGMLMSYAAQAQDFETAKEAVKNMGVGWNLGNTLDANTQKVIDITDANYWGQQGLESETCWGQPKTTRELIKMMKEAGFGAIRVPVTWYNHMDKDGNVNAEWMARVKEVVDYVIDEGLYCIVNVHHDTGADSYKDGVLTGAHWIHADEDNFKTNQARFEGLWKQIAETFKDYNNKLLFESYNEMLDKLNSWCFASFSAKGQYDATVATSAYNAINSYAKSFVDVVRASGGNNSQRNLVVNTYAAANGSGTWNTHLKEPLTMLTIPSGEKNHIAVEVHAYPSIVNGNSNKTITYIKSETKELMDGLNTNFVSKGIPVIIGEWGTSNVDAAEKDYDVRKSLMFQFCEDFIAQAKALNIATFYWMGLSNGTYRSEPSFNEADLAETIIKGYYGSSENYKFPTHDTSKGAVAFEGEKTLDWGQGVTVQASMIKDVGKSVEVELTYKLDFTDYDDIQFMYNKGGWQKIASGLSMDGTAFEGADFSPSGVYGIKTGDTKTSVLTFNDTAFDLVSKNDLIIQGHGVVITKVVVKAPATSGIHNATINREDDGAIYNLHGQRVSKPRKGLYIQNGKKLIAK